MKHLLCRIIGHRWGWPDIPFAFTHWGIRILAPWRECLRCGERERDDGFASTPIQVAPFEGQPQTFKGVQPDPYPGLGDKVNKAMGWE